MKENKRLLFVAGVIVLVVVLGVVGYFAWINIAFVDTLHAQVWAQEADIRSVAPGRVSSLMVSEGEWVAPGDILLYLLVTDPATQDRVLLPIRSSLGGVVSDLGVDEDSMVAARDVVAHVWDPDTVCIEAQVNEARVAQVQVGQSVRVRIKQRAVKRTHWGWVSQVGARTRTSVGTGLGGGAIEVPVRIDLPADANGLTPGMSADVRISVTPRIW